MVMRWWRQLGGWQRNRSHRYIAPVGEPKSQSPESWWGKPDPQRRYNLLEIQLSRGGEQKNHCILDMWFCAILIGSLTFTSGDSEKRSWDSILVCNTCVIHMRFYSFWRRCLSYRREEPVKRGVTYARARAACETTGCQAAYILPMTCIYISHLRDRNIIIIPHSFHQMLIIAYRYILSLQNYKQILIFWL